MNVVSVSPQFDRMRNFMLDVDKYFEPLNYVAQSISNNGAYPPHNIHKKDNQYIIEMALAGFTKSDIECELQEGVLTIKAKKEDKDNDSLIHQGIASRSVVRKFTLSEYIKVDSADFKDGILYIKLYEEVPEEKKAKTIKIK